MSALPPGTRVWLAIAACPGVGRPAWAGEGVVSAHIPCSPCWQQLLGGCRHITLHDLAAAGDNCQRPTGYMVRTAHGHTTAVTPGDPTVIAIPITESEAA